MRLADRQMVLQQSQFNLVPIMLECYGEFFESLEAVKSGDGLVLDFSRPAFHCYKKSGIGFHFPGIPEDDSIGAYTFRYTPKTGDVVFDVGAHAGMTTYFLSQLVGPSGRVVAFEPDESNYSYLLRNIEYHGLSNVYPVKKAMDRNTANALFNMDGTMAAGIAEYLVYPKTGKCKTVETISFVDACGQFGTPAFAKFDIEGAELAVLESALPFLREQSVHLAFDSYHRLREGTFTWESIEAMLRSIEYECETSDQFGQMFTWAHAKRREP